MCGQGQRSQLCSKVRGPEDDGADWVSGFKTRKLRMQEQTRGLSPTPSLVLVAELILAGCLLRDGL